MIRSRSWRVLEDTNLPITSLLADRELRAILLHVVLGGLIRAGAWNTNANLWSKILASTRHRVSGNSIGHPCLNLVVARARGSLFQVLHSPVSGEAVLRYAHQLVVSEVVLVVLARILLQVGRCVQEMVRFAEVLAHL